MDLLCLWCCFAVHAVTLAQTPQAMLLIEVRTTVGTLADVDVVVNGISHKTNDKGTLSITVPPGTTPISIVRKGFAPVSSVQQLAPGQQQTVIIELQATGVEEEVTVVGVTRTNKRVEDQPMRVEVLGREEIEEKMLMTPGDIVMMLNEMGGMRVQATSPSLGASSVRIQGMRGRYTRFLSDGLPLFGEQVGGLGLLQIPPMDLGQVEVVKGVASSLYGAGAMGGVVNLISRKPGPEPSREVLVNRSTRGGTDAVFFASAPLNSRWGATLLAGGHWQQRTDVNDDGWADLPGYSRGVFRPRIFWDGGRGSSFFATTGVTVEDRSGGSLPGRSLPNGLSTYPEALDTVRVDAGALGQRLVHGRYVATIRATLSRQHHQHLFGSVREKDRHDTAFGEVALRGNTGRHTWVVGSAIEYDGYRPKDLPQFEHSFVIPGAFVQDDVEIAPWLSLSASGRLDYHNEYGTFLSPRLAGLFRFGGWSSRLSIGTGFFGPSALTEETESTGLTPVTIPGSLKAERGRSTSFDLSRSDGPASYTFTWFASRIEDPLAVERTAGLVLTNASEATTNAGVELIGTLRSGPFAMTTTYTYVRSLESEGRVRLDVPLTPRHSAGLVGMWEKEDVGRLGVELYYTGVQRLDENPFRSRSEPYLILGLLGERQFGKYRLFLNGENLTGVRQTKWDPLIRPVPGTDGRRAVDAWAPLEGRNVNGGVRLRF